MTIDGLIALSSQPPAVDAFEAEKIAIDLYGLHARAESLPGERDRNFRLESKDGGRFVLKLIDASADAVIVAGQIAVLAHLTEQAPELPAPRIVATRSGENLGIAKVSSGTYRAMLVTYLPGALALTVKPGAELLHAVGKQLAQLDHALRGFFHPALAQPIAWDVRRASSLLCILDYLVSPADRRLVGSALAPLAMRLPTLRGLKAQAIHGDGHPRNLLVDEPGNACVGILDFGDMIHAPLVLEPAVAMAEFLIEGIVELDALDEILVGYTSVQPLEPADIEALYDLILARAAVPVLIQAWRTRHEPGGAAATSGVDENALAALERLASRGRESLTSRWHQAAGTRAAGTRAAASPGSVDTPTLLQRRHRTLGAHAELSYDRPLHLVRGDGVWVYTSQGDRLLDVYNNVPHVGHSHPHVVAAISGQVKRIASNTRYLDEGIIKYVERLTSTLPPGLDACVFVNSGSEANDVAWRIAKSHTGRGGALVMTHAYHGITDAVNELSPALCPTSPPHVERLAAPIDGAGANECAKIDVDSALARLQERGFGLAAFMIDSALTSTGIYDPPRSWAEPIAAAVHEAGGLIIGDEVQFGLGRSGTDFWGFARRGYVPDIVTLGKPVGNGYPLGVVITRRDIIEKFQKATGFFSTFGGNPVAAAAGLAVLEVLDRERLVDNAKATGDYLRARLRELYAGHEVLREVRGAGLMTGIEVAGLANRTAAQLARSLVNELRERGVLIGSEGPQGNVLKLRPPMPFRPEHADLVIEALRSALAHCV